MIKQDGKYSKKNIRKMFMVPKNNSVSKSTKEIFYKSFFTKNFFWRIKIFWRIQIFWRKNLYWRIKIFGVKKLFLA